MIIEIALDPRCMQHGESVQLLARVAGDDGLVICRLPTKKWLQLCRRAIGSSEHQTRAQMLLEELQKCGRFVERRDSAGMDGEGSWLRLVASEDRRHPFDLVVLEQACVPEIEPKYWPLSKLIASQESPLDETQQKEIKQTVREFALLLAPMFRYFATVYVCDPHLSWTKKDAIDAVCEALGAGMKLRTLHEPLEVVFFTAVKAGERASAACGNLLEKFSTKLGVSENLRLSAVGVDSSLKHRYHNRYFLSEKVGFSSGDSVTPAGMHAEETTDEVTRLSRSIHRKRFQQFQAVLEGARQSGACYSL